MQRAIRTGTMPGAKGVEIRSFGSFASGLYLPTADMDLVALSKLYLGHAVKTFCQKNKFLHILGQHLTNENVAAPGTVSVVAKAKVPLVKFVDKMTGIKVDISFENDSGLKAIGTFDLWKEQYLAMPMIVVLIKQMLAMRDLNEVFTGGLGGFSIICLMVSMLQLNPQMLSNDRDQERLYGELLLNFLDLYGNKFNRETTGITMNPPGYFDKRRDPVPRQNDRGLTIVDPNNAQNDISGGSRNIEAVFQCFRSAHAAIQRRLTEIDDDQDDFNDSILGCFWGGNYSSFMHQRNKLSLLQRGHSVSPPPAPKPKQPKPEGSKKRKRQLASKTEDARQTRVPEMQQRPQLPPKPAQRSYAPQPSRPPPGPPKSFKQPGPPTRQQQSGPPRQAPLPSLQSRMQHPLPQRPVDSRGGKRGGRNNRGYVTTFLASPLKKSK